MGRKKGKQSGEFQSKSQSALHRRTLYVDHASEADRYRNPTTTSGVLGSGHGYRASSGDKWSSIFTSSSSSPSSRSAGGRDAIDDARRDIDDALPLSAASAAMTTTTTTTTAAGLSRLRRLLEERVIEDRLLDRRTRLRLQRSRMPPPEFSPPRDSGGGDDGGGGGGGDGGHHEAGWLLSHDCDDDDDDDAPSRRRTTEEGGGRRDAVVPSLQILAARALGPHLPAYCTSWGSDSVGGSLQSLSGDVLSELSVSLASASTTTAPSDVGDRATRMFVPTTNGAVRALARSGVATGLVLRGAPLRPRPPPDDDDDDDDDIDDATMEEGGEDEDDGDDAGWLSDGGLLALCPRISPAAHRDDRRGDPPLDDDRDAPREDRRQGQDGPAKSSPLSSRDDDDDDDDGHWETLDFDSGLDCRMSGCFRLRRLELIGVPLAWSSSSPSSTSTSRRRPGGGGISVRTLRAVLRSCSSLTHLSLAGCFCNWEDVVGGGRPSSSSDAAAVGGGPEDDVGVLLCGSRSLASLTRSVVALGRLDGDDDDGGGGGEIAHLLPRLMPHDGVFRRENLDGWRGDVVVPGLDELLPELRVLDVSHCGWVTPGTIVRYLLNVRRRCLVSAVGGHLADNVTDWREVVAEGGTDGHAGASTSDSGGADSTNIGGSGGRLAVIAPSLRHLNVRGCDGLLPDSPHLPSWMEGWRERGVFDGLHISVDRQVRRR